MKNKNNLTDIDIILESMGDYNPPYKSKYPLTSEEFQDDDEMEDFVSNMYNDLDSIKKRIDYTLNEHKDGFNDFYTPETVGKKLIYLVLGIEKKLQEMKNENHEVFEKILNVHKDYFEDI